MGLDKLISKIHIEKEAYKSKQGNIKKKNSWGK